LGVKVALSKLDDVISTGILFLIKLKEFDGMKTKVIAKTLSLSNSTS